jgi:hypothetical protein
MDPLNQAPTETTKSEDEEVKSYLLWREAQKMAQLKILKNAVYGYTGTYPPAENRIINIMPPTIKMNDGQ